MMTSVERRDWFACVRCVLRCRAFGRTYYEVFGSMMADLNVGAGVDVFSYIEDFIEESGLNPRAICNAQFTNSGVCTCEFLAESDLSCIQNYHLHVLPGNVFSYRQLAQICRGLFAHCVLFDE